jgi:hypothetical protein
MIVFRTNFYSGEELKRSLCFLFLIVIVLSGLGCNRSGSIEADLNKEFSLSVGQQAYIKGEDLELRFIDVLEDSRCPKGVECFWAGRASCEVGLTLAGSSYNMILSETGLTDTYFRSKAQGYEFTYHLTPYPEAEKEIAKDEYRLHLIVTKLSEQLTDLISSIIIEPSNYEGQEIVVIGYYRGWDLLHDVNLAPPVTRSDWVVKDSTGAIYVSASSKAKLPETLKPDSLEYMDVILKVKGVVHITSEGQPYIEATSIERLP